MTDLLGYAASCAVLATFLMRTMVPLRLVAILSNVLFIGFGYAQHIYPVFFLHVALLPINTWRLIAGQTILASQSRIFRPASAPDGSRPLAFWFAVGLLAGLCGSLAVLIVATAHQV